MRCHEAPCAPGLRRLLLPRLPRARRMSSVRFRHASRAPSLSGIEKAAPLCPEGTETPLGCHEMSCDVMFRRAAPVSARLAEAPPSQSCMSFLHRVSFHSRRCRLACGASLFRAYRMGARACVRAGAVRAPDCAREQAQGAGLPSVPLGFFRAGAKQETERPADAASSCLILPQFYRGQAFTGNYFIIHERIAAVDHGPDAPIRPETDCVAP